MIKVSVNELGILAVRHEADLLRFLFFGSVEIRLAGDIADLFFEHFAERKIRTRKLFLRQFPKEIALVLPMVFSAEKAVTVSRFVIFDAGVMAGRDLFASERDCHAVERREFQT